MLIGTERARSTFENDSNKDDLAGDAWIDQSGFVKRGSGATSNLETDSSIEFLRRGPAGGYQEDVGVPGEAGCNLNVIQVIIDRLVFADSTGTSYHSQRFGAEAPLRLENIKIYFIFVT